MLIKMLSETKSMTDDAIIAGVKSGAFRAELEQERAQRIVEGSSGALAAEQHGNANPKCVLKIREEITEMRVSPDTRESTRSAPTWPW